jgi:hypothetical protein
VSTGQLKPCACGRVHRKLPPEWVPAAVKLYTQGQSYALIAGQLGCALSSARFWVQHEGVTSRDRSEAGKERARRRDPLSVRPPIRPEPCACGCGRMTSGKARRRGEDWTYAKYAPGCWTAKPRPAELVNDRTRLKCWPWIHRVEQECQAQRIGFTAVAKAADVAVESFLNRAVPRPDKVLSVSRVLGIDPAEALDLAGWPKPSPMAWKILLRMRDGDSIERIADQAGMRPWVLWHYVYRPEGAPKSHYRGPTLSDENLQKLTPLLKLTSDDIAAESQRREDALKLQTTPGLDALRERGAQKQRSKQRSQHFKEISAEPNKKKSEDAWERKFRPIWLELARELQRKPSKTAIRRKTKCKLSTLNLWLDDTGQEEWRLKVLQDIQRGAPHIGRGAPHIASSQRPRRHVK